MTWVNTAFNNFVGGEVSPDMYGRYDIAIYNKACEALINFVIKAQGPASFRPGFKYVNSTRNNKVAVIKEFIFNDSQAYILEFTDLKLRFFKDEAPILETGKTITGISTATQAVITAVAHGYSNGDEAFLFDILGPTDLNDMSYIVSDKTTDTFKIKDIDGNYISTVDMDAYVSGGKAQRVFELTTPYEEANDLTMIDAKQNADTMYIVHPSYQPRKLTRTSDTSWAIATYTGTSFPFTSANNFPRTVAFAQGRLWFGGTNNAPDKFWGSRGPQDDGTTRYDDFTTGVDADHAVVFILSPPSGKVEAIEWMAANNKYLLIGTFGGVSKITGSQDDEAIAANAINVRQLTSNGCYPAQPAPLGSSTFFIQRSGLKLRELIYDLAEDTYKPENKNLIASRIVGSGIKEIKFVSGDPDIIWVVRKDGKLIGLTIDKAENISGWHRHTIGGNGIVESLAAVPRADNNDQLWAVIKRTIDGKTRRYIEYLTDETIFPEFVDFYTGDKDDDKQKYANVIFDLQRTYRHLDSHLTWNGSDFGYEYDANLTIDLDNSIITSDKTIFNASDVGREIWGGYDETGVGGGRYEIVAYTSGTEVEIDILSEPDNDDIMAAGTWFFTSDTITKLNHLEGETVQVVADGGVHPDVTVENGKVTLDAQHSKVHIGYGYRGILKTLNIEGGSVNGPSQAKPKRITDIAVKFLDTLGASVGSDIYDMEPVLYANTDQFTGRPPQMFNGIKKIPISDEWIGDRPDDVATHAVVIQDYPLPCTVQLVDVYMEVTNE